MLFDKPARLIDCAIQCEQTVGSKTAHISWPADAYEPTIQWRLLPNGSIWNGYLCINVIAGSRKVLFYWAAGQDKPVIAWYDLKTSEHQAPTFYGGELD